jgi:hypothetical protein
VITVGRCDVVRVRGFEDVVVADQVNWWEERVCELMDGLAQGRW